MDQSISALAPVRQPSGTRLHIGCLLHIAALALLPAWVAEASERRPLSVRDAIETSRAMVDLNGSSVFVSPDGTRYAVMLIRGNVERNGNEIELRVGRLDSLAGATPQVVAQLFTDGLGNTPEGAHDSSTLTGPEDNPPRWLDNRHVAIFWEDQAGVRQVLAIDVETKEQRFLTRHATDVVQYGVGRDGMLAYKARAAHDNSVSAELLKKGFAVKSPDAVVLMYGVVDGSGHMELRDNLDQWIVARDGAKPLGVNMQGAKVGLMIPPTFAPEGRTALVEANPASVPDEWMRYRDETLEVSFQRYRDFIRQLFVIDVEQRTARPLWAAPIDINTFREVIRTWSPSGRSVLLGPTFLPLSEPGAAELGPRGFAEVDLATGTYHRVPVPPETSAAVREVQWSSSQHLQLRLESGQSLHFDWADGHWVRTESAALAKRSREPASDARPKTAPVRVELRQDLNIPPVFYAVESRSKRARRVLDLNPRLLTDFALGRVTWAEWKDPDGRDWDGRLYLPAHYEPGRKYPLVIQTHGYAPKNEFNIYGWMPNLGPAWSTFLAQSLAGRQFAVLQMAAPLTWDIPVSDQLARVRKIAVGYEAAIGALARKGIIDPERVGLMGYSGTGWHVEYALTHSTFPYAAALVVDNKDGNYFQAALTSWRASLSEELNGKPPFGAGLDAWKENSPAFNVERIRTPLQLQVTDSLGGLTAPVITGWEMFSRLRYLGKPVELYVVPNILRGSHTLQNPGQLLALQQRALDWWCFWLKGDDQVGPSQEWRELRERQRQATPRNVQ
jgi:hypothetical protein